MPNETTMIRVKKKTRERLRRLAEKNQPYDDVITNLLDNA